MGECCTRAGGPRNSSNLAIVAGGELEEQAEESLQLEGDLRELHLVSVGWRDDSGIYIVVSGIADLVLQQ